MSESNNVLALYNGPEYEILKRDVDEVREIFLANVQTSGLTEFDLDRVVVPGSGGLAWSVPDLNGEPEPVKEIEGVIAIHYDRRSFWNTSYDEGGGGTPPDCHSYDTITGYGWRRGMPLGERSKQECATCALSQWGSGISRDGQEDKSQACSHRKLVFVIRKDDLIPLVIDLPPTSVKPFGRFMLRLAGKGIPCHGAVVGLRLVSEEGHRTKYSVVSPRLIARLNPEQTVRMKSMADALRKVFSRVQFHDIPSASASRASNTQEEDLPEDSDVVEYSEET